VLCIVSEHVIKFYLGHSHVWGEIELPKKIEKPFPLPEELFLTLSEFVGDEKWTNAFPETNGVFYADLKG